MGKKSKGKKGAAPELSKKERKRLEKREAELAAQLAAAKKAGKKAEKKAAKKGKGKTAAPLTAAERDAVAPKIDEQVDDALQGTVNEAGAEAALAAADRVLADPNAADSVRDRARKVRQRALAELDDDGIRDRVSGKRAEREALAATADSIDRTDADAVAAYNASMAALGGGTFLTSTAERERAVTATLPETPAREADERATAAAPEHVAEVVTTEAGDVIAVGPEALSDVDEKARAARAALDADLRKPSDGLDAKPDFETNGNGQYKVKRPADGKIVGYTRVTTFIDALEHKGMLEAWKLRMLLEGAAFAETPNGGDRHVLVEVRDVTHRRDVAIAKAHKADRKGKLAIGELATIIAAETKRAKDALDPLAEQMIDLAGAHDKREKGTALHAIFEVADADGIAAVEQMVADGTATPADLIDTRAYLAACERAGIRVLDAEVMVVNDDVRQGTKVVVDDDGTESTVDNLVGVAGRLDRLVMYRRPGASRGTKVVADIKTGRVDYGTAKIAQQIAMYAGSQQYNPETHERSPLGASRSLGLLIHVQAGSGVATILEVDLSTGARGNRLAGEVRQWRSVGARAIDLKAPIVTVNAAELDATEA